MFRVSKSYGAKHALVDLNLHIRQQEFIFITGPSGAGKTTLLKMMYRGERTSQGQIIVDGVNLNRIARKNIPALRRKFGIIFQDYKLIPHKTIFDNVALVLECAGMRGRMVKKRVSTVLRYVGLEDRLGALPPSLSGGEQQRVAVARAVVGNPDIILADEPTGNLDAEAALIIIKMLKAFHMRGTTVIVASHDMDLIYRTGGRLIYLDAGRIAKEEFCPGQRSPIAIKPNNEC